MQKEQTKQVLLDAAKELLMEMPNPEDITSRMIVTKAGTNLAMINYYFKSKDELISMAVGQIIMDSAGNPLYSKSQDIAPLKRLWNMLWELCTIVLKFQKFTKVYVPYILLQSDIEAPFYILPILREYFGSRKNETECRIIAYQLISSLQLIFYRSDVFKRYTGIDVIDETELKNLLKTEFDLFFKEGADNV